MVGRKNLGIELKCFTWLFGSVHLQSQNKISIFCDFQLQLIRWLIWIMSEQRILCLFLLWAICFAWRKILFIASGCKSQPSQPAHETMLNQIRLKKTKKWGWSRLKRKLELERIVEIIHPGPTPSPTTWSPDFGLVVYSGIRTAHVLSDILYIVCSTLLLEK